MIQEALHHSHKRAADDMKGQRIVIVLLRLTLHQPRRADTVKKERERDGQLTDGELIKGGGNRK